MQNIFYNCDKLFYSHISAPVAIIVFLGRKADENRTSSEKKIIEKIPFADLQDNNPDFMQHPDMEMIEKGDYYTEIDENKCSRSVHVSNNGVSFCTSINIGGFKCFKSLYYDRNNNTIKVKQVKNPLEGENQGSTLWENAKLYRSSARSKNKTTSAEFSEEELSECVDTLLTEISTFPNLDKYLGEEQLNFEELKNKIKDAMNGKKKSSSR